MPWYPFHYHDVASFKTCEGIDLGTVSDAAAKHYDAFVTDLVGRKAKRTPIKSSRHSYMRRQVFNDKDPGYDGCQGGPFQACVTADPTWQAPKIIQMSLRCFRDVGRNAAQALKLLASIDRQVR